MSTPTPISPLTVLFGDDDQTPPPFQATSLPYWWLRQCLDAQSRLLRLQLVWLDVATEIAQHEVEFIRLTAQAGERMTRCGFNEKSSKSAEQLMHCYNRAVTEINDAAFARLRRISELSHDFREQIWDEI
ncbi:hypothetical protein [Modicisalibacter radicis]|uniref:hypothetical protein n=1 Tax=Halomonas sp. EAR18 TaxID=2518972 RepID=UPI00109D13A9|nr:hypothetical protein [Halomonas sp. EAR18]